MKLGVMILSSLLFVQALGGARLEEQNVFKLVNFARTQPKQFHQKYQEKILKKQPDYAVYLQHVQPQKAMQWDDDLAVMCKQRIEEEELDPTYRGKNNICGQSGGLMYSSSELALGLDFILETYQVIHEVDNIYFGIYVNPDQSSYFFLIGSSCDRTTVEYEYREWIDVSAIDDDKVNTAKNADYLSEYHKKMIKEINMVRHYPQQYIHFIKDYLDDEAGGSFGLSTSEYYAGMELIAELEKLPSLSILQPKKCLYSSASSHSSDCAQREILDHQGSDGSSPFDRIEEFCDINDGNENLSMNGTISPRRHVIGLLIDEGISGRGHRYNILNPSWKYIGVDFYELEEEHVWDGRPYKQITYNWVQNFGR